MSGRREEAAGGKAMDRRAFLSAVTAGFLAAPLVAQAQPAAKVARLGVLLFSTPAAEPNLAALLAGLRDLGYVEGRNIVLEYRGAEGRPERVTGLAHQIVALKPDLIVVLGGDLVPFVKGATSTIPVVMLTSQDPVEAGVVASFARPGGNLTGVAFVSSETAASDCSSSKRQCRHSPASQCSGTPIIPTASIATPRRPRGGWASTFNPSKLGGPRSSMGPLKRPREGVPKR